MIKVTNLAFSFPEKDLYEDVNFTIEDGQSCAFIGSSGSGKSTLAQMMLDPEKLLFDGKIEFEDNCKLRFVSQFYDYDENDQTTVFDYLASEFIALQAQIDDICEQMGTAEDLEPLLEKYQDLLDAFDAIDGNNYDSNIAKKLGVANLSARKDLAVSKLSGGEFKLVQVIKQMLANPTFLIMDEPDSFLDFENLSSLKNLINSHKGTMLTITHSRFLLNHCFNKILHLENKKVNVFDGTYTDYNFDLLQFKIDLQELAVVDDEEIARNEELIEKLRFLATEYDNPANGKSLNARVKIQERLEQRRTNNPFINVAKPAIDFSTDNALEDEIILSVEDFTFGFDEVLAQNVSFEIGSTDKVALIGANGTGKTSLMREILGGKHEQIKFNENTTWAYLSQNQGEMFNEKNTIYDEFFDLGFETYDQIKGYLKDFGFDEEKMTQRIQVLSGGEKNILGLAKMSCSNANFLILDEPNSHLDTYAQIALEEAINAYSGAMLVISHDFYTIANCMDYVLIIEDKHIRKMRVKKFKRMIYAKHFSKDYLQFEEDKKELEVKIEKALSNKNFELAKVICEKLEELIAASKK
ncbi:MAG: ABC-F family ATP-binding cassette domain-containing protein [Clostridia bacterium]